MVVLFGFLFGCFACFCVLVGCFVLELALLRSDLCSTFEPPKRDIVNAFANSFYQHNKVRRPGESHRGAGRKKKKLSWPMMMASRSTTERTLREVVRERYPCPDSAFVCICRSSLGRDGNGRDAQC